MKTLEMRRLANQKTALHVALENTPREVVHDEQTDIIRFTQATHGPKTRSRMTMTTNICQFLTLDHDRSSLRHSPEIILSVKIA